MVDKRDPKNWSNWRKANYEYFKSHLELLSRGNKILDLGAGDIQFADLFFEFDYTAVDFHDYPDIDIQADLTKALPFPDESYDIIILSNTLEHIPNTQSLLDECYRILKPQGLILGTIPFLVSVHQAPYDFNRYTRYQLENFLKAFKAVSVWPLGSLIDTYDTIERKTFDLMPKWVYPIRVLRRLEMRIMRKIFRFPARSSLTQGYGFHGYKPRG